MRGKIVCGNATTVIGYLFVQILQYSSGLDGFDVQKDMNVMRLVW